MEKKREKEKKYCITKRKLITNKYQSKNQIMRKEMGRKRRRKRTREMGRERGKEKLVGNGSKMKSRRKRTR